MNIELRELSLNDGLDVFEMIKEIGPGENGFGNSGYDMDLDGFPKYLEKHVSDSKGINISPQYVPQTMYWLFIENRPIGIAKLRHYLNDSLRKHGGHIGYSIRPSERGNGYGSIILKEALKKAQEKNIDKVLITCDENNILSRKVAEANKGVLEEVSQGNCRYWIEIY